MTLSKRQKNQIKSRIKSRLATQSEVHKIVIFGSFVDSHTPHDIDIAVFQDSDEKYIPLAMKYRELVRELYEYLPVDMIPVKIGAKGDFLKEIDSGEIIYER